MGAITSPTQKWRMDKDGKFLALRVSTLANMGGYLSSFAPLIPTFLYGTLLAGVYTTPAVYVEVRAVFTNTVPVDAYRGAGRPEAAYLLERLVDRAARETGLSQVDIRRKNFIPSDAFPYQTPVALQYDSGDYDATLDQALKAADVDGFESTPGGGGGEGGQAAWDLGYATYIEACGVAPSAVPGRSAPAPGSTRRPRCASIRPAR